MSACSVTVWARSFPFRRAVLTIAAVLILVGLRQGFDEALDKIIVMPL